MRPAQKTFQEDSEAVVAMFRDPRRRDYSGAFGLSAAMHIYSGLFDFHSTHCLSDLFCLFLCVVLATGWLVHGDMGTKRHPEDLIEYVKMHRACQGRMLLGMHCNVMRKSPLYFHATDEQRRQAVSTVEGMGFVGLTDYWQESICLFHAMFGGKVTMHEMDNVR
jgi:hypothetical protein